MNISNLRRIDKVLGVVTVLSLAFWTLVIFAAPEPFYVAVYSIGLYSTLGAILWYRWEALKAVLQNWQARPLTKFLVVGYLTVLYEEILAALANHLAEGFSLPLYLERVTQFWALNIFAFTGFILGWYFLTKRYQYSYREVFYLAGFWGLFAEHTYAYVGNPIAFVTLVGPTIVTYGIIALPMVFTAPQRTLLPVSRFKKYLLTYLIIFAFSIAPIVLLQFFRSHHPDAFPPANMVPL